MPIVFVTIYRCNVIEHFFFLKVLQSSRSTDTKMYLTGNGKNIGSNES
jgi:hypothetical protein